MHSIYITTILILTWTLVVVGFSLHIEKSRNKRMVNQAIAKGYASWELDQAHYPPIRVFNWK
jgi:hypothetical protein